MEEWEQTGFCDNKTANNLTSWTVRYLCSKVYINLTSCEPVQTINEIDEIQNICISAEIILPVFVWFTIVSGLLGNGLAVFTIVSLPLSTATFYVGLLASSDMVAVFVKGFDYVMNEYEMLNLTTIRGTLFQMIGHFSVSYSNWLLVLICVERFLTVRFPLQKRYMFTVYHAKISVVTLAFVLFTVHNIIAWHIGYLDTSSFSFLNIVNSHCPLLLIMIMIFLISFQLRSIQYKRESFKGSLHMSRNMSVHADKSPNSKPKQRLLSSIKSPLQEIAHLENSITKMMTVAAVFFAILTTPHCIMLFILDRYDHIEWFYTPYGEAVWVLLHRISQILFLLNLCINFFLYFLSAKKFRTQLSKVILRGSTRFRDYSFKTQNTTSHTREVLLLGNIRKKEENHCHHESEERISHNSDDVMAYYTTDWTDKPTSL